MAKRKKRPAAEGPTCNCLLLCDDVLESKGKGKHHLKPMLETATKGATTVSPPLHAVRWVALPKKRESLKAVNRRMSKNRQMLVERARANTIELTGKSTF